MLFRAQFHLKLHFILPNLLFLYSAMESTTVTLVTTRARITVRAVRRTHLAKRKRQFRMFRRRHRSLIIISRADQCRQHRLTFIRVSRHRVRHQRKLRQVTTAPMRSTTIDWHGLTDAFALALADQTLTTKDGPSAVYLTLSTTEKSLDVK